MKDDPVSSCPECEGAVKRLLYPVGIVFKGSGWYINDSRGPDKAESESPKPAESKTETKTETKTDTTPSAPASASAKDTATAAK